MGLTSTLRRAADAVRSPRVQRRMPSIICAGVAVAIVLWAVTMLPLPGWLRPLVGACIAALVVGSDVLYRKLKATLGRLTAFAAVCLSWSVIWVALALASPTCLGPAGAGRCTPAMTASYAFLGLLFPLVVPVFTMIPWFLFRAGRVVWHWRRNASRP